MSVNLKLVIAKVSEEDKDLKLLIGKREIFIHQWEIITNLKHLKIIIATTFNYLEIVGQE